MILQSIELNNFMCYSGNNKFDFTEGINIIIGDNGYGKSKLYDAFYWVMYDRCFDTRKKDFFPTNTLKKHLISDKAINEIGEGFITASVILTFHHTEKNSIYILERRYKVRKTDNEIVEDRESEEIIKIKDLAYLNAREVADPVQIASIKKSILPDNIKPYMWFQGEQIESIIDFNKENTLTQAINVLSNISKYDNLINLANNLKDSANKEYQKKQRDLSGDKAKSESLELERVRLEDQVKALELQDLQIKDNLATAEEKSENLLNKIADATKIRELEERKKAIQRNLQDAQDEFHEEQLSLHKRMFTNKWILKGTEGLFNKYSEIYNKFEQTKLNRKAEIQVRLDAEREINKAMFQLPIDVPEPIHLENMLEMQHCLVCNRPAIKDSPEWLSMKSLLDRSRERLEVVEDEDQTTHDFSFDLKKLYHNGLVLSHQIPNIDDDIKSVFRKLRRLDKRRKTLSEDFTNLDNDINTLIVNSSLNVSQATNILNEYAAQNDLTRRSQREVDANAHTITKKKQELGLIEAQLDNLVTGEIPAYLTEKVKVLTEFKAVTESTRKRVFHGLVTLLETEANKHYGEMMQGNLGTKGVIKFKQLSNEKNYMPELVDENGNVLLQLNMGNIILIKLATIMAIISARQGSIATDLYTLITDAPTSVFGEDYTIGFCKTVSKVYRQSIIMSKEFYKNTALRNQLLSDTEVRLGKVYMITPTIPENERSNRNSLSTLITPLN